MTKHSSMLRTVVAFLLCAGIMLSLFPVIANAVSVYVWDGKTSLQEGRLYYITDTVKVKKDIVIPKDTKLSIRSGGELRIYSSGSITVQGELAVAIGGLIINSGTLNVKSAGKLSIYGVLQSSINGRMSLAGSTTVYNNGVLESSSATKMYKGSEMYIKGAASFYKSSDVKLSGTITTTDRSDLELRGIFTISLSGTIEVNGHLTIGAESNVRCSGTFILSDTATYTRFKSITITKSGTFTDSRPESEFEDMTVDILSDGEGQAALGILEFVRFENFAQRDCILGVVRHLNAECRLALDRRNTHGQTAEIQTDIVSERRNLRDFDAGSGLDLIARNRRTSADAGDPDRHAEARERIDQLLAFFAQLRSSVRIVCVIFGTVQEAEIRRNIRDLRFLLIDAVIRQCAVIGILRPRQPVHLFGFRFERGEIRKRLQLGFLLLGHPEAADAGFRL